MQPDVLEHQTEHCITKSSFRTRLEKLTARSLQKLAILDASGTDLLAGAAAEATIYMTFESRRVACETALTNGAHQVEAPARPVVFITRNHIGRTSFKTQAAMNAGEQFFFFPLQS